MPLRSAFARWWHYHVEMKVFSLLISLVAPRPDWYAWFMNTVAANVMPPREEFVDRGDRIQNGGCVSSSRANRRYCNTQLQLQISATLH